MGKSGNGTPAPEWGYVRIVDTTTGTLQPPLTVGRASDMGECVFCEERRSAQPLRIRCHVAGIKSIIGANVKACTGVKRHQDESEAAFAERKQQFHAARLWCTTEFQAAVDKKNAEVQQRILSDRANGFTPAEPGARPGMIRHKRQKQSDIASHMGQGDTTSKRQEVADQELATAIHIAGIAPNVLDQPFMQRALRKVAIVGPNYIPLSRNATMTTLLENAVDAVKDELVKGDPVKRKYGETLVSDGGSGIDRKPFLNLLLNSPGFTEFVTQKFCGGSVKNAEYIAGLVCDYIESRGEEKKMQIVQVLQDNATRSSWKKIEERCPWLVAGPCMTHVLDLLLEAICQRPWLKDVIKKGAKLRKFIRNHQHVDAAFAEESSRQLTKPGATRFATVHIGLTNLKDCRSGTLGCLNKPEVIAYVRRNKNQRATPESPSLNEQYMEAHEIAASLDFWEGVDLAILVMDPAVKLLRLTDSTSPTCSKIYYNMFRLQQRMKELHPTLMAYFGDDDDAGWLAETEVEELVNLVGYRWDYGYTDIQGVGYLLDPEFWDMEPHQNDEIMESFHRMLLKTFRLPSGLQLGEGIEDSIELSADDLLMEDNDSDIVKAAQETLDQRAAASKQLIDYMNKQLTFSIPFVQQHARTMSACSWWDAYGYRMPELQFLAMRVLGQVSSSGSAERAHKDMNFIRSKARNKMDPARMDKILYVRHNCLQLEKVRSSNVAASDALAWDLFDCLDDEELGWTDSDEWEEARREEEERMEEEREEMIVRSAARAKRLKRNAHNRLPSKAPSEEADLDAQNMAVQMQAAAEGVSTEEVRSRSGRSIRPPPRLAD